MGYDNYNHDVEKDAIGSGSLGSEDRAAIPGESFEYGNGVTAKLQRLAGKFHVEQRGIERVPEDERDDTSLLNVATMWLSANMVVSSFAIGLLGQSLFFLGFVDAILTCFFFNLIGVLPVCYFSTFGPRFGLRQMVLSRFWFGWHGVKLIAVFNILACIGWSAVNTIVGGELIHAVNNDVPGWAGIIIIAVITLMVCFFGYKIVHVYEFWSWIPTFIIFLITLGCFAHSGDFVNIPMGVGTSELGSVLSFASVIYGFATGWTSYAADYTVYQPRSQSRTKVFLAVFFGLMIPLLFTEFLGIAIMTATTMNDGVNKYADGYAASGTGGLLAAVLFPPLGTFGKFCLIILALSIIANNCPNVYSIGLTMQVLARWTQRVPRFVWTTIATGVYIAIAIPGYSHFETVLENFMNFIGYWLAIYEGVSLCDHFFYKRGMDGYDVHHYDQPGKLPPGIAAVFAFCCGIAGMVTGMSQVWFVGPIALHAGEAPFGGDVGFELGFAFAFVSYAIARHFELKYFGR
ncbi:purine-cytosine permease [Amniculicola lignicola CBS 123094]|uniref:Purine-cytosine permease n=1 Tax=Amniculicola lignicola CBS 123094 TaxID=1392246 RepID=A0A6A5X117_9PLEO|nr:purine-cytosine permease [Amniculicola lignicola CBS 123094]